MAAKRNKMTSDEIAKWAADPDKGEIRPMAEDERWNERRERFCQIYASDSEFFGNGVQTYIEVYKPDQTKPNWYRTACTVASTMLSNAKVYTRINEILEETGFNDVAIDKQLSFLIHQHADFGSKLGAIREYNKLKARVLERIEHSGEVKGFILKVNEVGSRSTEPRPDIQAD
jgi:hypothetical protein